VDGSNVRVMVYGGSSTCSSNKLFDRTYSLDTCTNIIGDEYAYISMDGTGALAGTWYHDSACDSSDGDVTTYSTSCGACYATDQELDGEMLYAKLECVSGSSFFGNWANTRNARIVAAGGGVAVGAVVAVFVVSRAFRSGNKDPRLMSTGNRSDETRASGAFFDSRANHNNHHSQVGQYQA